MNMNQKTNNAWQSVWEEAVRIGQEVCHVLPENAVNLGESFTATLTGIGSGKNVSYLNNGTYHDLYTIQQKTAVEGMDAFREINWGSCDDQPLPFNGHPWDTADRMVVDNLPLLLAGTGERLLHQRIGINRCRLLTASGKQNETDCCKRNKKFEFHESHRLSASYMES